jgi:hypothetical protein
MLSEGLSDRELCDALGLDYPAIVSEARIKVLSSNDLLVRRNRLSACASTFFIARIHCCFNPTSTYDTDV